MVTVTCTDNNCPNGGIDYNVIGSPAQVECGGCHVMLAPTDERPDPELPAMPFPEAPA